MSCIEIPENCTGCGACFSICPQKCILMEPDNEGFLYPVLNKQKCIGCGLCEKVCPVINVTEPVEKSAIASFAAFSTDESVINGSSSGGVFTHLASAVLEKGGVVFGVGFDEDFFAKHTFIERAEQLSVLQGSKYVQSKTGNSYVEAKAFLDSGRCVLFTGTPCQINGLHKFLGKEYDNLFTQDIICHGVPSPELFRSYLESTINRDAVVKDIFFRDKRDGWKKYSLTIVYKDGKEYSRKFKEDGYGRLFLKNLSLRPSCYECSAKGLNRASDITLADFWGIEAVCPEMYNEKGVSFIVINTQKGKELLESITSTLRIHPVSYDIAVKYNSSAVNSSSRPKERDDFYKKLNSKGYEYIKKKYLQPILIEKIKSKIKK